MDKHSFRKDLFWLALVLNIVLFGLCLCFYNVVYATNDDFRMSLIVSGAYTGKPSAVLVFMKYPIALLLAWLYTVFPGFPWYGVLTMLAIFVPCCLFCYYMLKQSAARNKLPLGILLYLLFFAFVAQKHVLLPQFTLTAGFTALAALVLVWAMPPCFCWKRLVGAALFAAISYSIRAKVFLMVLPFILLIFLFDYLDAKERKKIWLKNALTFLAAVVVLFSASTIADMAHPLPAGYREFNTNRALVYDYGRLARYDANKDFFDRAGIDETTYYDISARYLDIDDDITAKNLKAVASYNRERNSRIPLAWRLGPALSEGFTVLFEDPTLYPALFTFVTAGLAVFAALAKKRERMAIVVLAALTGMMLELTYLCFLSRPLDRLTEVLLLTVSLVAALTLLRLLPEERFRYVERYIRVKQNATTLLCNATLALSIVVLAVFVPTNQSRLTARSVSQNLINERLELLNTYAANHPKAFIFYDAYDFIAATDDVFRVRTKRLNTDSLGNWYVRSPDYYKRNLEFGFKTSVEGLTDGKHEVYYAAIGNLKRGITLNMKDRYNMEPRLLQTIPYTNNNIGIFEFVPCS